MENNKLNWDLEDILKGKTLEYLYKQWKQCMDKTVSLVHDFYKTKTNFIKWLNLGEKTSKISNRLVNYISNKSNEDLSNPQWIGWIQKLTYDSQQYSKKTYFVTNLILKNEKLIRSYLKDKNLTKYTREFDLIFKTKKHILDDKSEKLLSSLSSDGGAINDVFSTLTDSDLKFKPALDSKGKQHDIKTLADVSILLKNKDGKLWKNAWINMNQAFDSIGNTLSKTLFYYYLRENNWAKVRNYKNYIDAALDEDEVDLKLLLTVYDNVKSYRDLFAEFKKLRANFIKKIYKLDKVEPWDMNLDLTGSPVKYTPLQAQNEVLKALKPLGEDYIKNVKIALDNNWISWMPKANKLTGAYSIGSTYGLDKMYILMNFDGSSDAVSTLAHEMGHSINSYYINQKQDVYAEVDMFTAEIASIVNENLLCYYWLNKYTKDEKMKLHIYENMLSTFFACTSRQITFSKFEYDVNEMINKGQPFTLEYAKKHYIDLRKEYEGLSDKSYANAFTKPYDLANSGILRIPHFYMGNFYVWKYAISQLVAIVVANKIYHKDKNMIKAYKRFLEAGQSIPPLDIIKLLGIDLHKQDVYIQAKEIVFELLNKFKKIKR